LEPAVALQRQLIGLVVELAQTIEHGRLPRLSLPPKYLAAKLSSGVPALAGEPIPLPVARSGRRSFGSVKSCRRAAPAGAADRIRASIEETRIGRRNVALGVAPRDQTAIRTGAAHGASRPIPVARRRLTVSRRHALQRAL